MRLLLALLLGASFVDVTLEAPEGACVAEGAIACVELAPGEALARVQAPPGAEYAIESAGGAQLGAGALPADGFVPLPAGAARLVVYA